MSRSGRSLCQNAALALATLCAPGLSACSSAGPTVFERLGTLTTTSIAGSGEATSPELTRAELDRIPSATIAVSSSGGPRAYLVPLADNGGYLDYRDANGNSVVMLGGAVSGLETAGYDLDGVQYDPQDPIAHPTPLGQWPVEVWREYQFSVRHAGSYGLSLHCIFRPQGPETIVIAEIGFTLVRVEERCRNAVRQITNTHWVDASSGFIWKSEQWLGPKIGSVTIEIVRPYGG